MSFGDILQILPEGILIGEEFNRIPHQKTQGKQGLQPGQHGYGTRYHTRSLCQDRT